LKSLDTSKYLQLMIYMSGNSHSVPVVTSMLWISTSVGWPAEGRLGWTRISWPAGPNRAQRCGIEYFSGVNGLGGAEKKGERKTQRKKGSFY